jgi:DNA-binding transcriptional ArsR family regulator
MIEQQEIIFKALSDKNRIRIIKMLQKKPLCVCEIRAVLKLAVSTVSQHLSILREAGLITKLILNPTSPYLMLCFSFNFSLRMMRQ